MSANLVREQQIASSRNTSAFGDSQLTVPRQRALGRSARQSHRSWLLGHRLGQRERRATSDELRSLGSVRGGKPFLRSQPATASARLSSSRHSTPPRERSVGRSCLLVRAAPAPHLVLLVHHGGSAVSPGSSWGDADLFGIASRGGRTVRREPCCRGSRSQGPSRFHTAPSPTQE